MNWKSFLFSYRGRVRPLDWWLTFFVLVVVNALHLDVDNMSALQLVLATIPAFILSWIFWAVSIKRWHDIGKSGWWMLVHLIPMAGILICIYYNGFVSGEKTNNAYGPSSHTDNPDIVSQSEKSF